MRNEAWVQTRAIQRRQAGAVPIWLIIVLGILGGMVLYWYTTPQETPAWIRGWLPGMPEYTGPVYRWYDDRGRLQVTDHPPRDRPYETVQYRSDVNVAPPGGR